MVFRATAVPLDLAPPKSCYVWFRCGFALLFGSIPLKSMMLFSHIAGNPIAKSHL